MAWVASSLRARNPTFRQFPVCLVRTRAQCPRVPAALQVLRVRLPAPFVLAALVAPVLARQVPVAQAHVLVVRVAQALVRVAQAAPVVRAVPVGVPVVFQLVQVAPAVVAPAAPVDLAVARLVLVAVAEPRVGVRVQVDVEQRPERSAAPAASQPVVASPSAPSARSSTTCRPHRATVFRCHAVMAKRSGCHVERH